MPCPLFNTKINIKKPNNCNQLNVSFVSSGIFGKVKKNNQITIVLKVSTIVLAVEETFLEIVKPEKLKKAIDKTYSDKYAFNFPLSQICLTAKIAFSNL